MLPWRKTRQLVVRLYKERAGIHRVIGRSGHRTIASYSASGIVRQRETRIQSVVGLRLRIEREVSRHEGFCRRPTTEDQQRGYTWQPKQKSGLSKTPYSGFATTASI